MPFSLQASEMWSFLNFTVMNAEHGVELWVDCVVLDFHSEMIEHLAKDNVNMQECSPGAAIIT